MVLEPVWTNIAMNTKKVCSQTRTHFWSDETIYRKIFSTVIGYINE